MNWQKTEKYILIILLACLAVAMPLLSLDAGISGDEQVHLEQARDVVRYYSSFGEDRTALHTPVTNLKYYGQSFDNLTALLGDLFQVDDIYNFRHICNSLAGWLCILFTALVAIQLGGYRTAIFTILFMAASPRFIGHSLNNLKDIPFALGYIASIFFTLKVINNIRQIQFKHATGLTLSMAFTLSIRPGGLLVFCYFLLFSGITLFILQYQIHQKTNTHKPDIHPTNTSNSATSKLKEFIPSLQNIALITIAAYFIGLLFWPYALENPIINPLKSMSMMSHYPVILRQLFESKMYWSDQLPWYYLLKYVAITTPVIILPLAAAYLLAPIHQITNTQHTDDSHPINSHSKISKRFLIFTVLFPFAYTILAKSNVYGAWRHLLFTYPSLVVMAALGFTCLLSIVKLKSIKFGLTAIVLLTLIAPIKFIYRNHPIEYTYFNQLAGDFETVAQNYEVDYYYHSVGEASKWLKQHIEENELQNVKIASNYGGNHYFRDCTGDVTFKYTPYYARGNADWDYGIFYRTTISPSQTRQNLWPPVGTIKTIEVENVPVCVIVKRQTRDDYLGKKAYENGAYLYAETLLEKATHIDPGNEIAWINLGKTYLKQSKYAQAKAAFNQCLNIIPDYEPARFYLAEIEISLNKPEKAAEHYQKILASNSKSFKTYVAYAKLHENQLNYSGAFNLLNECLRWNPHYKEAKKLKEQIALKLRNNNK